MVGGKMKLRYFFFLFIWNPASSLTAIRTGCTSARSAIRISFSNCDSIDSSQNGLTYNSIYVRYKNLTYICTHKIESNFVRVPRSIPRNFLSLGDLCASIFARPRSKIRQNSWCWVLDWRRREDAATTARLPVFLARFSVENTDEFRSRNTPGLAPCGQTSKGLGTLGRRWIEARLVGCRLASARRCSSLRIAGQPTASSTIGLQPASG